MNRILVTGLFAALLLAGCSSVSTKDIEVYASSDAKANFSGYKSYAWSGASAIVYDPNGKWAPPAFDANAEIKYLIDREMRRRGISENSTHPDLLVAFAAGIDMTALDLKDNPATQTKVLVNVPKGGLAVALVDAETGFLIWMGMATADVQERPDAETAKARLDYAVKQMFRKLPK
jgi:uncharacterized protein YceK